MRQNFRILLTCVGGSFTPGTIAGIRSLSFIRPSIIGVDCSPNPIGRYFCDRFYQVPAGDHPDYFATIKKIAIEENIHLIIPTSDEEALELSRKRKSLGEKTILACTDYATLEIISNKIKTYEKLKKNNLPVPDYFPVNSCEDFGPKIQQAFEKWDNIVIKPAISRGGRDVIFISDCLIVPKHNRMTTLQKLNLNMNQLKKNFHQKYPLIIMEKIEGFVYDLDLLGWKGKPITVIPRKRIIASQPNSGHLIFNDKKLIQLGHQLIEIFNLSWPYDCDFMMDKNSNPIILEINPRQSGSVAVTHFADLPFIENIFRLALNLPIKNFGKITQNKKIVPYTAFKEINQ